MVWIPSIQMVMTGAWIWWIIIVLPTLLNLYGPLGISFRFMNVYDTFVWTSCEFTLGDVWWQLWFGYGSRSGYCCTAQIGWFLATHGQNMPKLSGSLAKNHLLGLASWIMWWHATFAGSLASCYGCHNGQGPDLQGCRATIECRKHSETMNRKTQCHKLNLPI